MKLTELYKNVGDDWYSHQNVGKDTVGVVINSPRLIAVDNGSFEIEKCPVNYIEIYRHGPYYIILRMLWDGYDYSEGTRNYNFQYKTPKKFMKNCIRIVNSENYDTNEVFQMCHKFHDVVEYFKAFEDLPAFISYCKECFTD